MRNLSRSLTRTWLAALVALAIGGACAAPITPPAHPALVQVEVSPAAISPGAEATITVRLEPAKGIKINRYPRTRLVLDGSDGIVAAGEASVGNDTPPPPDKMATNYFEQVDPLTLTVRVADRAAPGAHHVEGQLTYFYCMPANGFCAPKRETVRIPVTVR